MTAQSLMDGLIESGWLVIKSGFDETYFRSWAQNAKDCLDFVFGQDSIYSQHFRRLIQKYSRQHFFAAVLLLGQIRLTLGVNDF
ncbi:MAG: hypothetical protein ACLQT6_05950 [Desulfomonilaceae bacterium]